MSIVNSAKQRLRSFLGRSGYVITRAPFPTGEAAFNLVELVAERHMSLRGGDFTCVQIGANDGITNDSIRDLILKHRWRSILVEPVPATFQILQKNYSTANWVTLENCAIAETDGVVDLNVVEPDPAGISRYDQLASFSRDVILKHGKDIPNFRSRLRVIQVPALTMRTLLQRHAISELSLLQIDTEGFDYEVIKMTLAANLRPAIIRFEHSHLSPSVKAECHARLASLGYRFITENDDVLACMNR